MDSDWWIAVGDAHPPDAETAPARHALITGLLEGRSCSGSIARYVSSRYRYGADPGDLLDELETLRRVLPSDVAAGLDGFEVARAVLEVAGPPLPAGAAVRDPLTGAASRSYLEYRIGQLARQARFFGTDFEDLFSLFVLATVLDHVDARDRPIDLLSWRLDAGRRVMEAVPPGDTVAAIGQRAFVAVGTGYRDEPPKPAPASSWAVPECQWIESLPARSDVLADFFDSL